MIYLDYQATTPMAPDAIKAMMPWIEKNFANPHSPSRWGREAEAAIEVARKRVGEAIGLGGGSVAFTGSATEALNWAITGTIAKAKPGRNRIVTVATEHAAVLDTCEWLVGKGIDLTILPVQPDGMIDLDLLERELDERVALVAVMLVNNEIGVIQPVADIARMAHGCGALMLCDAVQALGRLRSRPGPIWSRSRRTKFMVPRALALCGCEKATSPRRLSRRRSGAGFTIGHAIPRFVRRLRHRRGSRRRADDA